MKEQRLDIGNALNPTDLSDPKDVKTMNGDTSRQELSIHDLVALSDEELADRGWTEIGIAALRETAASDVERPDSYPDVIPACPSWCKWPVGHMYDSALSEDHSTHVRYHNSDADKDEIRITQEEFNRLGDVTLGRPYVDVWIGGDEGPHCTAEDARRYAQLLLEMADRLEEIERASAEAAR